MDNFRIVSADKDSNGQYTLRLFIHEHEVEATFATEENPMLLPRLKQMLLMRIRKTCQPQNQCKSSEI